MTESYGVKKGIAKMYSMMGGLVKDKQKRLKMTLMVMLLMI